MALQPITPSGDVELGDNMNCSNGEDRRSYTQVLIGIETELKHTNKDIRKIEGHLEKLNNSQAKQDLLIERNCEKHRTIARITGAILLIVFGGGGIASLTLMALGVIK